MRKRGRPPTITCLCKIDHYDDSVREALSCFLHQTWPHKRLVILNRTGFRFRCAFPHVFVLDTHQAWGRYTRTQWFAVWSADLLYAPWHLTTLWERAQGLECRGVAPDTAWVYDRAVGWELRPFVDHRAYLYSGPVALPKTSEVARYPLAPASSVVVPPHAERTPCAYDGGLTPKRLGQYAGSLEATAGLSLTPANFHEFAHAIEAWAFTPPVGGDDCLS